MCEDGTKTVMNKCKPCDASTQKFTASGTVKNSCKERNSAYRHKRLHHDVFLNAALGINTIDENVIEECNEEILV